MFKYIVEENFFDLDDFSKIEKYLKNYKINNLGANKKIVSYFDEDYNNKIVKKYKNKMFNYLKILEPEKVKFFDYWDIHWSISGENFSFPIHNDAYFKLLSVVVYIYPEKNFGTFIYNSNKPEDLVKEIEWLPNKAFIFSRKDKSTWHSYKSNNKDKRFTVNLHLCTKKLDDVIIFDRGRFYFFFYKILKFLKIK
jgi:hypothetical protein